MQSTLCSGCGKENETESHIFFRCEIYARVWHECLKWWGLLMPLHGDCKSHFLHFFGSYWREFGADGVVGDVMVCGHLAHLVITEFFDF